MTLTQSLLIIALLICASAFVAVAEISLAASRRLRLRQLADEGDPRAEKAIRLQEQPGDYFTVVQVGQNAISILGGIVGSSTITGSLSGLLEWWMPVTTAQSIGSVLSFLIITSLFILFADLLPRRLSMVEPEYLLLRVLRPMMMLTRVFKPVVWFYGRITDTVIRILGLPDKRDESITSDDILAMTEDGARAGVLAEREQQAIANIFELDTRTVASSMTQRDRIAYFLRDDPDHVIRARIAEEPFSTYPVCEGDIEHIVGYVDAKDLFQRVLNNQPISLLDDSLIRKILLVPEKNTLAEVLDQFQQAHEDFAVILNEYSMVVGVVTLNDVMSTVMGDLVSPDDEEQIIRRDDRSWLIDGVTSIDDVMRALDLETLPNEEEYETLAGFLMLMLRRIPRRTDCVDWAGYRFEVMDVDSYRIDQVLVTRLEDHVPAVQSQPHHPASALSAVAAVVATGSSVQAAPAASASARPQQDTPSVP